MTPRIRGLTCGVSVAERATRPGYGTVGFGWVSVAVITVNVRSTPADDLPVLDREAPVHDHVQSTGGGDPGGRLADHAELQPQRSRSGGDRLGGDLRHELGAA